MLYNTSNFQYIIDYFSQNYFIGSFDCFYLEKSMEESVQLL